MVDDGAGDRGWSTEPGQEQHGITFGASPPPSGSPPPTYHPSAGPPRLLTGVGRDRIRTHPEGLTILILGILSVVICPLIGPLAWSMGNKAMGEVRYSGYRFSNAGFIRAGRLLGAAATCLILVYVVLVIALVSSRSDQAPDGAGSLRAVPTSVRST